MQKGYLAQDSLASICITTIPENLSIHISWTQPGPAFILTSRSMYRSFPFHLSRNTSAMWPHQHAPT